MDPLDVDRFDEAAPLRPSQDTFPQLDETEVLPPIRPSSTISRLPNPVVEPEDPLAEDEETKSRRTGISTNISDEGISTGVSRSDTSDVISSSIAGTRTTASTGTTTRSTSSSSRPTSSYSTTYSTSITGVPTSLPRTTTSRNQTTASPTSTSVTLSSGTTTLESTTSSTSTINTTICKAYTTNPFHRI